MLRKIDSIPLGYYVYGGVFAFVLILISTPVMEADIYWHIRMGQDILNENRLTGNPAWTFGASDDAWITTQTLFEVLSYWIYSHLGWVGIYMIRVVGMIAVFATSAWAIKNIIPHSLQHHYPRILGIISLLFLINITVNYEERPQTLSYAFFIVFSVFLYRFLITGTLPKLVPFLFFLLAWVWLHGAAVLAVPLLGLAYLIRLIFSLSKTPLPNTPKTMKSFFSTAGYFLLMVIVTLLTPITWRLYERGLVLSETGPSFGIIEWQPPEFWGYNAIAVTSLALCYLFSWIILARKTNMSMRLLALEGAFLLGSSLYLTQTNRNLVLLILLLIPFTARRLSQVWYSPALVRHGFTLNLLRITSVSFLVGAGFVFILNIMNLSPVPTDAPKRIIASLGIQENRKLLNEYNSSGMLQLFTGHSTIIDGRNDRYRGEGLENYMTLIQGKPGWERLIDTTYAEATDAVLKEDRPLVYLLKHVKGWRKVCADQDFVWLTRLDEPASCVRRVDNLPVRGLN